MVLEIVAFSIYPGYKSNFKMVIKPLKSIQLVWKRSTLKKCGALCLNWIYYNTLENLSIFSFATCGAPLFLRLSPPSSPEAGLWLPRVTWEETHLISWLKVAYYQLMTYVTWKLGVLNIEWSPSVEDSLKWTLDGLLRYTYVLRTYMG